ncbi:MAG: hypothetical protein KA780_00160 [Prolixibacteraceae bacterium]|jgi:hypothetical protein|nr:hypothetical protein [Prolixibacteraceae bacterium]HPJ78017.1 hypothetical protein [Prolixibacteraceae bacterium]HRV88122.1 hypothetical protein [Prolixibacteraceae bacterium]
MARFLTVLLLLLSQVLTAQDNKWDWWNEAHGWKPGDPGWRNWMILSPGYLGPNALPVPEPGKGVVPGEGEFIASLTRHYQPGDPTQDLSFQLRVPFHEGKVAIEAWGVLLENYNYTSDIRDLRFSRDQNGKGIAHGDFYFAALVQLARDRRFPDTMLRMACKTASGHAWAARYTDTPGYFLDLSFSRSHQLGRRMTMRPFAMLGFYSWQTYDEATPQNDALLYGAGIDFKNDHWLFSGNLSGYSGYLKIHDKPVVATLETRYDWHFTAAKVALLYGLRHWDYQTFRFSFIWKFPGIH